MMERAPYREHLIAAAADGEVQRLCRRLNADTPGAPPRP